MYVSVFDPSLTIKERQKTFFSIGFLLVSLIPIISFMVLDSIMYNVNGFFRDVTAISLNLNSADTVSHQVEGDGFLASTYRHLFNLIDSSNKETSTFSNLECLPVPQQPNFEAHKTIWTSIVVLLVLACLQSYIKRWRCVLAGFVYPERDEERSAWLFNHLLALNSGMFFWLEEDSTLAKQSSAFQKIKTLLSRFFYKLFDIVHRLLMSFLCCYCFGIIERKSLKQTCLTYQSKLLERYYKYKGILVVKCIHCGKCLTDEREKDGFINCESQDCKGLYCVECFLQIDNECKLCMMPLLECMLTEARSEISFEKDSSDEEI